MFNENVSNGPIKLHLFYCFSNSAEKLFIVGITINKYYRQFIRCNHCDQELSDRCIGYTNNGYYDVLSMFDNPSEVIVEKLCVNYFHDNKSELKTNVIIGGDLVLPVFNCSKIKYCEICKHSPNNFISVENYMKLNMNSECQKLYNFKSKKVFSQLIKFYYVIDCCLCTLVI